MLEKLQKRRIYGKRKRKEGKERKKKALFLMLINRELIDMLGSVYWKVR